MSLIFGIKHSKDLNVGFKRFKCWIDFDIRNSKALHVFDIKLSKFEFWVEFEVRHSLFKRFKSWIELFIRHLRYWIFYIQNLNVEYRT